MLQENVRDALQVVNTLITQPILIEGSEKEVSLLSATKDFDPSYAMESDLAKIVQNFLDYPEKTEALLTELRLLSKELRF